MAGTAASYEISPWRMTGIVPVDLGIYALQQAGQIEAHTARSLILGTVVAVGVNAMNARLKSSQNITMTSDHRWAAAGVTGITTSLITAGFHPGASPGERASDFEAVAADALSTGVLTGVLMFAVWRKSRRTRGR